MKTQRKLVCKPNSNIQIIVKFLAKQVTISLNQNQAFLSVPLCKLARRRIGDKNGTYLATRLPFVSNNMV